jgi:OOP family OmpA-OmpF porin
MRIVRYVSLFAGAALLAGCVGQEVEQLNDTTIEGESFTANLAREYRSLANFEAFEMQDWADADYFARKGLQAAAGEPVGPADLGAFNLPGESVQELSNARDRLLAAFADGARETFPVEAAVAQTRFDCWVEQQEENIQPDHIAACKDEFFAALALIERPVLDIPPVYYVFFDFDRSEITPEAQDVINQVASDWDQVGTPDVSVVGHADRAGPRAYNQALSLRRAQSTENALVSAGVPGDQIEISGEGEDNPLVPTPDGVREPSNRRAEIRFVE